MIDRAVDAPLGRSIRPTLFDLYADPELVLPIVIANLMTPRLWELSARLEAGLDLGARLGGYAGIVNKYFYHLSPEQVEEMDGTLRLDEVAACLGSETVDRAVDGIRSTVAWRLERGTLQVGGPLLRLIDEGLFPHYVYGTLDELHAHRTLLGRKSRPPMGVTSCLDEAALFGALVATSPIDDIDGIAILGTAAHYTVLTWSGDPGDASFSAWWFYGKSALISHLEYERIVADYDGDYLLAFKDRLPGMDLVVSRRGCWDLVTGTSALEADERELAVAAMDRFFGGRLEEVQRGLEATSSGTTPPVGSGQRDMDALFEKCIALGSAEQVRAAVVATGGPAAAEVLACFRDTEHLPLDTFIDAARRGLLVTRHLTRGASAGDVLEGVTGQESVLPGGFRVAMPDEVLLYGTASALDRELCTRVWDHPRAGLQGH